MNKEALSHFPAAFPIKDSKALTNGIINTTDLITDSNGERYIFQRINTSIFADAEGMMRNIDTVTNHIRRKAEARGKDPERATLHFLPSDNGTLLYRDESGAYRMSKFIANTVSFEGKATAESLEMAGRAFGTFALDLADIDASLLTETIPDFHNTPKRIAHFLETVEKDPVKRVESAKEDIEYLISLKDEASRLSAMNLPLRVTHNDTKTSNVLVDKDTLEPLAVIDLDTVMPGLLCHDFADSIRYSANKVAEDEKEYWKAGLDLDMYRAYAKGFIPAVSPIITEEEKTTLVLGVITIVYEQAVRFLDDYLAGDVYYHTDYPEHNLIRTRTQTGLLKDMLEHREEMERIAADPELYR